MPKLKPGDIGPNEEEDASIEAAIANDPDEEGWKDAGPWRPATEMHPELVERSRGKQKLPTKEMITIRLDADIVDYFRATGKDWHVRVNDTLRRAAFGDTA